MAEQKGYDRNLDKVYFKEATKSDARFLNIEVYSYDGGTKKVRIKPVAKNTNPNADPNKKWINQKAVSGLTKEEVKGMVIALEKALEYLS